MANTTLGDAMSRYAAIFKEKSSSIYSSYSGYVSYFKSGNFGVGSGIYGNLIFY